jgi:hypothetical protein
MNNMNLNSIESNSEFNDSQVRNLFSYPPTCILAAVYNIVNIENDSQGGQEWL